MTVPSSHPLLRTLAEYDANPKSFAAPAIPAEVKKFLRAGLVSAEKTCSKRTNPFFGYGSSNVYQCRNAEGEMMTIIEWGNTDGYGLMVEPDDFV